MEKWIRIIDGLPHDGDLVNVKYKNEVGVFILSGVTYSNGSWSDGQVTNEKVIAWQLIKAKVDEKEKRNSLLQGLEQSILSNKRIQANMLADTMDLSLDVGKIGTVMSSLVTANMLLTDSNRDILTNVKLLLARIDELNKEAAREASEKAVICSLQEQCDLISFVDESISTILGPISLQRAE